MPQMMPLNWLMLFSFFSIMLLLFNVLNYYSPFNKATSLPSIKTIKKTLIWKW
uniref:ATP synthase complex subunit 8 n=1 Tax=Mantis religiosa TaxID=7507 RepID=A0A172QHM5_MANRE|nr:ATP synthase F0 subunit 8 [Mantis religiosa]AND97200.1 ATP synthase F0 subunit 8 [Mantis religiosa]QIJ99782.1 ATP synthase F0 subunit 8 [Mantis religiosa]